VSIALTGTYFQDFNTLANTGTTSNILPVGWQLLEKGTNANDTYSINNGSSNAGNTYSYGATGDTDRAFGTLLSGSLTPTIGVSFINNTGVTIIGLDISYRGEQWRLGAVGREDRLNFQYSLNATSLNTGTWVDVNSLDFIAPVTTGTVGARDGNAEVNFTNISDTISNLNIGQGETFWLRWLDFNASGADDGLAVDDFSITPITLSLVPTVSLSVSFNEILESNTNTAIEIIAHASGAVSGNQTLTLDLSGTANFINDYTLSSVTITIPDGQTTGSVLFNVVNDSLFEGDEVARLTLTNPSAGVQLGSNISADITIIDNDVIQITEFMYQGVNGEFVEFTNLGTRPIDMTGWSYIDDQNLPTNFFSLSAFGTVQPGESVILTEANADTFRNAWGLDSSVKVIGNLGASGVGRNLGRNDEINLYDATGTLVDRLTYGDQSFPGTIRTQGKSGWTTVDNLSSFTINSDWVLSNVGDAQNSYTSLGGDVGNPGIYLTEPSTSVGAIPTIQVNTATTTDLLDGGVLNLLPVSGIGAISGVINDPTDPARIFGLDFILADADTPVNDLTVSVSSSNQGVVSAANLNLTGVGANRNLTITPNGVGFTNITVTVSDGANSGTYTLNYAASAASVNPATTRFLTGASDASTAIAFDGNYMLVADDEDQTIRLYDRHNSGAPLNAFNFTSSLGLSGSSEVDIEASSRLNDVIYWMGSHSNNSSGGDRPNRERIFATEIGGSGVNTTLTFQGYYQFLEDDLIAWDNSNGHGLGTGFLGLAASAVAGVIPESTGLNGFNIEGLTFAPDNTTAYIGFRAPNLPIPERNQALIVPVTNFTSLPALNGGVSGSANFGDPIFLDLGGRGIRSIERNSNNQYVIIAGPADQATGIAPKDFRLYTWNGNPADSPILRSADLTALSASGGSFESIVTVPDSLNSSTMLELLVDNGDTIWYNNGVISKDLSQDNQQKFRREVVQLGGIDGITKIHSIQGTGVVSPLIDEIVTIEAIVVGDFQRVGSNFNLRGFYVQEEDHDIDDNPLTSEGLFIFDDNFGINVGVGDLVRVTGTVGEFTSGTSSLTQLRSITEVTIVSENNPLPTPAALQFPLNDPLELEAYEGMLVTIETTLAVTEHFQLGRFGQVVLSSDGETNQPGTDGRLDQFTQFNDPSVEGFAAYQQELAKRRIVLDDGLTIQNPEPIIHGRGGNPLTAENTLRGGDMVTSLTGILDDRFGAANLGNYRIQPVAPVEFQPTNPRPINVPDVGGSLKVASFNVLNYFNGNGTGGGFNSPEQRGADNALEFERQRAKIIAAIIGLNADVVGLIEIENDGYGELSAIQDLVNGLNDIAGAGTYAFVDPDTGTLGGDAIAVGFVYNTNTVKIAEGSTIATLTTGAFDPVNVARHRVPLAVTFEEIATGEQFTTVTNHFKSKGQSGLNDSNDPNFDQGDGQGFWNDTRTLAAQDLATWLATNPTGINDPDILILGDLNAYAKEDPIKALETAGYQNLVADSSYSFVFDGQWGSLDYALATSNLNIQVSGAAKWHINADEPNVLDYNTNFKSPSQIDSLYAADPFRSSDHDPVIVGLDLLNVIQGTNSNDRLIGENGRRNYIDGQRGVNIIIGGDQDDIIIGGQGRDILTGGSGNDIFRYNSLIDIGDVITDFTVGEDKIDLSRVLQNIGYSGSNPIADKYVGFRTLANDTILQIDADGNGAASPVNFIRLLNISATEMNNVDNFIF
jgi:predicted extracellular nuclease